MFAIIYIVKLRRKHDEQGTFVSVYGRCILLRLWHFYKGIYEGHAQGHYDLFGVYWHWLSAVSFNGLQLYCIMLISQAFGKDAFIEGP